MGNPNAAGISGGEGGGEALGGGAD